MKKFLVAVAFFLLLEGCANLTEFQTARVVPEDVTREVVILGYGRGLPYMEYIYRRGIGYHFDWEAKYTFPGPLGGQLKFQFLDQEKLAMAVSLGANGGYYFGGISGLDIAWQNHTEVAFLAIPLAYYISYDILKKWSAYFNWRYFPEILAGRVYHGVTHNLVFGLGTQIGGAAGVYLEANYFRSLSFPSDGMIYSFAYYF